MTLQHRYMHTDAGSMPNAPQHARACRIRLFATVRARRTGASWIVRGEAQVHRLRALRVRSTFFMEHPMVRKNYAPDENAPRQPYADKDAGVGMGRISLDDDDDFEDDLEDEEEDDAEGSR
jgi:hypothetical protein